MDLHSPLPNREIAILESRVDHLETEISYLNRLLMECGFEKGIETLKWSAEEMLREDSNP